MENAWDITVKCRRFKQIAKRFLFYQHDTPTSKIPSPKSSSVYVYVGFFETDKDFLFSLSSSGMFALKLFLVCFFILFVYIKNDIKKPCQISCPIFY